MTLSLSLLSPLPMTLTLSLFLSLASSLCLSTPSNFYPSDLARCTPALHKSLWVGGPVDLQVDFGLVVLLLPLQPQLSAEVHQVEGQEEAKHTHSQQTNVHL